jgi:hypothetical protein
MTLNIEDLSLYLKEYITKYRATYNNYIAEPPIGGGYPNLVISSYLNASHIKCFIASDGVIITDTSNPPENQWWVAGGPALMVDKKESVTPAWVKDFLKEAELDGKFIGIYGINGGKEVPADYWQGRVIFQEGLELEVNETLVTVCKVNYSTADLLKRMTFGALGYILDFPLPDRNSPPCIPITIYKMGFLTADRKNRKFYRMMEIYPHLDKAVWDLSSIDFRVDYDVSRDFKRRLTSALENEYGGLIYLANGNRILLESMRKELVTKSSESADKRLPDLANKLKDCINEFSRLLESSGDEVEAIYHDYLVQNPILLDAYATAMSKPEFKYPPGAPYKKSSVIPDFLLKYPDGKYKLVEIERPNKKFTTKQDVQGAEFTQARNQINEWFDYIREYYELLKFQYPDINRYCKSALIYGRSENLSMIARRHLEIGLEPTELYTYDDLLSKAKQLHASLINLIAN